MKPCSGCLCFFHTRCSILGVGCCEGSQKIFQRLSRQDKAEPLSGNTGAVVPGKHITASPVLGALPDPSIPALSRLESTESSHSPNQIRREQMSTAETKPATPTMPSHYDLVTSALSTGPAIGLTCPEITESIMSRDPHFCDVVLAEKLRQSVKATCST